MLCLLSVDDVVVVWCGLLCALLRWPGWVRGCDRNKCQASVRVRVRARARAHGRGPSFRCILQMPC
jgi:hypothetical protein